MPGSLHVFLGATRVGTFTNLDGDYNLFNFDQAYLDDPQRAVLSQGLIGTSREPIARVPRIQTVAPPFFANLLPEEGSLLRSIIARQHAINPRRDFPFLRALGGDLPGAVVLRGSEEIDHTPEPGEGGISEQQPLRFSLAGVQAKFSATARDKRLSIPMSGVGGSWIVKLPANAFARLPENEFVAMTLARAIGLDVPEIRLVDLDEIDGLPRELPELRADEPRLAYAIRRFDRAPGVRVHAEDFNQIANVAPDKKYEAKPSHWLAQVTQALCPPEDVEELVRRLVFGVCIGNNDMHLKNWGIIYPNGRDARLAPMYDYVCTRAYYPAGALALTIGEERAFESIDPTALSRFARRAELSERRTLTLASEVVERLRYAWRDLRPRVDNPALVDALERTFAAVPLMRAP
jgi:serine/threonine-protein kinase HipA